MELDYNNPKTWATAEIHQPPSDVDRDAYQKRIDAICGLTPDGRPTVLLTWMPEMENYSRYYCEWDDAGFGTNSHLRGTYKYATLYDKESNPIDVPPPRWAFKQYQSAAQYAMTDEQSRWQKSESNFKYEQTERGIKRVSGQTSLREVRPPHPATGRYIPMLRIGKHNHFCCAQAKKEGSVCYGDYRQPDDAYLELLRQSVAIREAEPNGQNPNEPISPATIRKAAEEAARIEEDKRQQTESLVKSLVDETYDEIMIGVTGDDAKRKAFSLPVKKQNGLYLPNLN